MATADFDPEAARTALAQLGPSIKIVAMDSIPRTKIMRDALRAKVQGALRALN